MFLNPCATTNGIATWFVLTDNVMKFTVRTLANQMNEELFSEMQKYLHRGPLINRWNYVLVSIGALPIAMHELAFPTHEEDEG